MKYQFKTFVNTDTEGLHIIIGLVETKVLNKVGYAYPLFKKLYVQQLIPYMDGLVLTSSQKLMRTKP